MIASEISETPAIASESTCEACQKDSAPMARNRPTCGLAIVSLVHNKLFDPVMHRDVVLCAQGKANDGGPGTELTRILEWAFKEHKGCNCRSRAAAMDAWGPDGCEKRIDRIVGWLRKSAGIFGIVITDGMLKALVGKAIANARKRLHNQS